MENIIFLPASWHSTNTNKVEKKIPVSMRIVTLPYITSQLCLGYKSSRYIFKLCSAVGLCVCMFISLYVCSFVCSFESSEHQTARQCNWQTGITKNLATFCHKYFLIMFLFNLLIYIQKELHSYVHWICSIVNLPIQR